MAELILITDTEGGRLHHPHRLGVRNRLAYGRHYSDGSAIYRTCDGSVRARANRWWRLAYLRATRASGRLWRAEQAARMPST